MLTVTSDKYSRPEDCGSGLLRLVHLQSGEELLVRKCNYYDVALGRLVHFIATECRPTEVKSR